MREGGIERKLSIHNWIIFQLFLRLRDERLHMVLSNDERAMFKWGVSVRIMCLYQHHAIRG